MKLPNTAALEIKRPKENVKFCSINNNTTFDSEKLYFMKPDKRVCLFFQANRPLHWVFAIGTYNGNGLR